MTDNHSQRLPLIDAIKKGKFASYIDELCELALQGDSSASIALGHIYFRGGDGVCKDYHTALYWFKMVKPEYDVTGIVARHIAIIYYKGLGVAKDHQNAAKYMRRSALHGYGNSMILFAIMQKKGDGTLKKIRASETILRASVCDSKLSVMTRFLALMWLYP